MQRKTLTEMFNEIKANHREVDKLMEGSREDILRSFFSLCKGDGKFKSEKQAAFLKSQTEDGVFFISQTLSFGTSRHSQRSVDWTVVVDDEGVVSITKRTNSKGDELYWSRGQTDTIAGKQAEQREKNSAIMQQEMRQIIAHWEEFAAEKQQGIDQIDAAFNDPTKADIVGPNREMIQSVRDRYQAELDDANAKLAEMRSRLK